MPADLQKAREIFLHAVGKLPAEQWERYVAAASGGDAELAELVRHYLNVHREAGSFLGRPAAGVGAPKAVAPDPAAEATATPPQERPGTSIGPYKLLQQIGEGGMGAVYMAEQTAPVQRKVAIKLIKTGMDSRQVVARFEAERQALAIMDHVNIARVFDGGSTETGRPYFVMELVHGVPITKYCDDNRLTPRQRLELFVPVCQAIQHAHQKGIIHRDIKPSNVMVTLYDGQPVPKVIDFGVAKATEQKLTERTLFTQYGTLVGTLEYMSPEQAELSALGVDTRSDIFSLGVLLYELLTGNTPLSHKTMKEAAYGEILRMIREEEAPKPSTRLSDPGEALASISAQRHTEPAKLSKLMRGELDWIVMKALEKDRNRRYETAKDFAADVQRYLSDEPVLACPASTGYRLRKFVRRNQGPMLAASLLVSSLVVGIVGTAVGLVNAERARAAEGQQRQHVETQRDRAQTAEKLASEEAAVAKAVNDFLQNDLLAEAAPDKNARNQKVTVLEVLGRAGKRVAGKFEKQPLIEAAIRSTIGDTYTELGDYPAAQPHLERALELRLLMGKEHPITLASMNLLALLYWRQGQFAKAEPLWVKTLEVSRRVLGEEHPDTLTSMNNLAILYQAQGQGQSLKAEPPFVKVLEARRRILGEEHPDTLASMNNLAALYYSQGEFAKAEPLWVQALEVGRRVKGEEHPHTLMTMNNLAALYQDQEHFVKSEQLKVKNLEVCRRVLGEEHPQTLVAMNTLALLYKAQGQFAKAEPLFDEALEVSRRVLGDEHPDTLASMSNVASLYRDQGQFAKAEPLYVKTLEARRRILGEEHPYTLYSIGHLAILHQAQGQFLKAEPPFVKVLEARRRVLGEEHPDTLASISHLAALYQAQGQPAKAEPLFREVLEKARKFRGEASPLSAGALASLGENLLKQLKHADAEALLRASLNICEQKMPDDWRSFHTKSMLGASLLGQKKHAEAKPLLVAGYEGLHEREARIPVPSRVRLTEALERLVQLYEATGQKEPADDWRKKLETQKRDSGLRNQELEKKPD